MKNILIVDDDQTSNFLSTKALERLGNVNIINTALNGKEAIDLFCTLYQKSYVFPDVVFLDLNMPIMDGFEFLQAFANLDFVGKDGIRIIVVSSSINPEDIKRAKALGAVHFVSKPLTKENLEAVLSSVQNSFS